MREDEKTKLDQAHTELLRFLAQTCTPESARTYGKLMESFCQQLGGLGGLAEVTSVELFVAAHTKSMQKLWRTAYRAFLQTPTGKTLGLPALPRAAAGRRARTTSAPSSSVLLDAPAPAAAAASPTPARLPLYDPRIDKLPEHQRRWARTDPLSVRPTSESLRKILIARMAMEEIAPTLPALPPSHPLVKDLLGRKVPLGAFIAVLIEWCGVDRLSEAIGLDIGRATFRNLPAPNYIVTAAAICVANWAFPERGGGYLPSDFLVPREPNAVYPMPKQDLLRLAAEAGFTPMHFHERYMTRPAAKVGAAVRTRYEVELDRWPGKIYDATNAYRIAMSGPQRCAVEVDDLEIPSTTTQEEFDSWFDASGELHPEARAQRIAATQEIRKRREGRRPMRTPEKLAEDTLFTSAKLVVACGRELERMGKDFFVWFNAHPLASWWHARLLEIVSPPDERRAAQQQGRVPEPLYLKPTLGRYVTRRHRVCSPVVLQWQWEALEYEWGFEVRVTESTEEAFAVARGTLRWQLERDGRLPLESALSIAEHTLTNEELLAELLVVVPPDPPDNWVPLGTPTSLLDPPPTPRLRREDLQGAADTL